MNESSDATVLEEPPIIEEDIPALVDQVVERMVPTVESGIVKTDDVVAMDIPETTMEQKGENITVNYPDIVADRRTNLVLLSRREFEQITTSPYTTIATTEIMEPENEDEEEYLTLREVVARRLRSAVSVKEPGATGQEDKITFLDIADASVRGISRIPGIDMKLDRYYDQDGQLTSYAFTSKSLSFSHEVKK